MDFKGVEITTRVANAPVLPLVLAKGDGGLLRAYASKAIYVYNGKNWAALNKVGEKYFRFENPCSDIDFDAFIKRSPEKYTEAYNECERRRYENGDSGLAGYSGKCESIPPGKDAFLPERFDGIYERWDLSSRIVNVSTSPPHRFIPWNAYNTGQHGVYEIDAGKCRFYPMPKPDKALLTAFRPSNGDFTLESGIGSFQERAGRIWFCPDFYDSEGYTGLGGIGYFDIKERKYEMYYSSQTSAWACSALMAEENKIWVALQHRPEGKPGSGGLAAFDISSRGITIYPVPEVIHVLKRIKNSLFLGTEDGIYVLTQDGKVLFLGPMIDKNGEYRLIENMAEPLGNGNGVSRY